MTASPSYRADISRLLTQEPGASCLKAVEQWIAERETFTGREVADAIAFPHANAEWIVEHALEFLAWRRVVVLVDPSANVFGLERTWRRI